MLIFEHDEELSEIPLLYAALLHLYGPMIKPRKVSRATKAPNLEALSFAETYRLPLLKIVVGLAEKKANNRTVLSKLSSLTFSCWKDENAIEGHQKRHSLENYVDLLCLSSLRSSTGIGVDEEEGSDHFISRMHALIYEKD